MNVDNLIATIGQQRKMLLDRGFTPWQIKTKVFINRELYEDMCKEKDCEIKTFMGNEIIPIDGESYVITGLSSEK